MEPLEFAKDLAKQAGGIMRANFALGMKKDWKDDDTPLTKTDLAINQLVLEAVGKRFPLYSFIGEEGSNVKESEYSWVCDPLDGTIPFSHGFPTFAFSLALTRNGESILGVIYDPFMDRLLSAEKEKGAFLNGERISVSTESELSPRTFVEINSHPRNAQLRAMLTEKEVYMPTLYSCVYGGLLVAVGEFVAAVYPFDKPWDAAAVKIIVEEAGGKVTDLDGKEQRYDGTINGFVASNGRVHQALIDALR